MEKSFHPHQYIFAERLLGLPVIVMILWQQEMLVELIYKGNQSDAVSTEYVDNSAPKGMGRVRQAHDIGAYVRGMRADICWC